MDVFKQMVSGPAVPLERLLSVSPLTDGQRKHISKIYALLLCGIGVYVCTFLAYSKYLDITQGIGAVITNPLLGLGVSILCLYKIHDPQELDANKRSLWFLALAAVNSLTTGRYIAFVDQMYPGVVACAFVATTCIFVCFSICALFSQKRSWLYLGGVLTSMLFYLMIGQITNFFIQSTVVDTAIIYASLLMYCGFILYDTQMAIAQFDRGQKDVVKSALAFFINFVEIFIKVLRIMQDNAEKKKRNE